MPRVHFTSLHLTFSSFLVLSLLFNRFHSSHFFISYRRASRRITGRIRISQCAPHNKRPSPDCEANCTVLLLRELYLKTGSSNMNRHERLNRAIFIFFIAVLSSPFMSRSQQHSLHSTYTTIHVYSSPVKGINYSTFILFIHCIHCTLRQLQAPLKLHTSASTSIIYEHCASPSTDVFSFLLTLLVSPIQTCTVD